MSCNKLQWKKYEKEYIFMQTESLCCIHHKLTTNKNKTKNLITNNNNYYFYFDKSNNRKLYFISYDCDNSLHFPDSMEIPQIEWLKTENYFLTISQARNLESR